MDFQFTFMFRSVLWVWCLYCYELAWSQDEVVKLSPHARAIRDVEDEELRSFFYGMSPWQVNHLTLICCVDIPFHMLHLY